MGIRRGVVIGRNRFVVDIERVESTYAWIKVIDGAGILGEGARRIRVYIPELRRRGEWCAHTSYGTYEDELLASKIALALRDSILNIRKELLAERRKVRKEVPEDVVILIRRCGHEWKRLSIPLWFKCVRCGLNAILYKCKTCEKYTPHIRSQFLGGADLQTGDMIHMGYLEQWVCTECLTPRTVRKGGSFARMR